MIKILLTCVLLTTGLTTGAASMALQSVTAPAADSANPELTLPETFQGGGMTLDQAVEQVRRQYPGGKIVSAETRSGTHVIKVLTAEGTVRTVRIPAR